MKTMYALVAILLLCSAYASPLQKMGFLATLPKEITEQLKRAVVEKLRRGVSLSKCSPQSRKDTEFIANLERHNKEAMTLLLRVCKSTKGWTFVNEKDKVTVEKCFLPAGSFVSKRDQHKGSKHACVRSSAILDVPPAALYKLFLDNSRVGEYNEHIKEVRDVQYIHTKASKITWCVGPSYGPFKARDFLSVINFTKLKGGGYVILNRPAYHSQCPETKQCVRAIILLAGNVIEPHGRSGMQSRVTQVAHINPGGGADNKIVASVINRLCAVGPPAFLRKLEAAAKIK